MNARGFLKAKRTRAYPIYYCMRRCYTLRSISYAYYSSAAFLEHGGTEEHAGKIKDMTVRARGAFAKLWKVWQSPRPKK